MPIFEARIEGLRPVTATSFEAEGWQERADIQRLLKERIACLEEGLMVLTDEFSGWLDSSRRIDLLCLDTEANLVVIELKRNQDGGHMELQALRYAAMVSAMTFDQAVETLARYRNKTEADTATAKADILNFLGWSDSEEENFAPATRIILAAADFGKELTTTVLWLRNLGLNIGCVRLKPYKLEDGRLLVDIQPLIPLPEASEFQTKIGAKQAAEREERVGQSNVRVQFWDALLTKARPRSPIHANVSPASGNWVRGGIGRAGFDLHYYARKHDSKVELWIRDDKPAFRQLLAQKETIESAFGAELEWHDVPETQGCRVSYMLNGGFLSPREDWPRIHEDLIDAMIRLNSALRPRVAQLP